MRPTPLVCALVLLASPAAALAQGSEATDKAASVTENPFLRAGIRLYNTLDFDGALQQLKKAENYAHDTVNDEVLVHMYEGIVLFESNRKDDAEAQFKEALALNENAQLPRKISPKTAALFEKVRKEMKSEKELVAPTKQPDVPSAKQQPAPAPQPAGGLQPSAQVKQEEASGPSVAPWVALGVGAVGAATGGIFALRAHSLSNQAQSAQFQDDAQSNLDSAHTSATIAYASLGVAVVGAATFAVLYLLEDHGEPTASTQVGSGGS